MRLSLALLMVTVLAVAGCTSQSSREAISGVYSNRYPSHEGLSLQLNANGRFVMKISGDTGSLIQEEGTWKFESSNRIVAQIEGKRDPEVSDIWFITLIAESPGGPGIFVSPDRNDPPIWASESFLAKKVPIQLPETTRGK